MRRAALGLSILAGIWLLGTWPPPVWWRDHWPRCTAMMRRAAEASGGRGSKPDEAACAGSRPISLADVAHPLQRMVVIGEDSRFWTHHGIDPTEIADALGLGQGRGVWTTMRTIWARRDRLRGASTITQQLAKNLYLSPSRNPLRKFRELIIARRLEAELPKARILELYLNVIEWGDGIYGAEAAARAYFHESASDLDEAQAALLAAAIINPRVYSPAHPNGRLIRRQQLILRRLGAVVEADSRVQVPR